MWLFFLDKQEKGGKHNPYFNPMSPAQVPSFGSFDGSGNRYSSDHHHYYQPRHGSEVGGNYNRNLPPYYNNDEPELDCIVSEWSDWSKCSVACGRGHKYRTRFVRVRLSFCYDKRVE